MAERKQDLFGILADRGEDVVGKIAEHPSAQRFLESANSMRQRMDDLQRKVRGIDALEARVKVLEKKVDQLSKGSGTAKRSTTKRTAAAKKPKAPPKTPPKAQS